MTDPSYFDCCSGAKSLGHKDDCKNNAKNFTSMTIAYDDPVERNVMQLTIPLKKIALDHNTLQAMIEFYGFFEVAKDQAISILHTHRIRAKQSSPLILPGNNGIKGKIELKVS